MRSRSSIWLGLELGLGLGLELGLGSGLGLGLGLGSGLGSGRGPGQGLGLGVLVERLAVKGVEGDAAHSDARASAHRPTRGADVRDVVVVELVPQRGLAADKVDRVERYRDHLLGLGFRLGLA